VETGSSSGKLVEDAATRSKTGRLASEGLNEDLHAFPETQHLVKGALLLDVAVNKGTAILKLLARELHLEGNGFVVLRGMGPNPGPRHVAIVWIYGVVIFMLECWSLIWL
jgi:hypothetical protein